MHLDDLIRDEAILIRYIKKSIADSIDLVVDKCTGLGNIPQEPDFVASLVINFTPELLKIMQVVFPNYKFALTGVFCHQKPLVNIGLSTNPEIGDLLFVYVDTDKNNITKLNSLLFQAKVTRTNSINIQNAFAHQLKLYSEWPDFEYKRAGVLNGVKRKIQPKTLNDGAQYLLINPCSLYYPQRNVRRSRMGCSIPNKKLQVNNDLAVEILDFLKFKAGRAFEADPSISNDDWTKMIWDILNITKAKASKRKNSGIINFPRQMAAEFDGCCFISSEINSIYQDLHSEFSYWDSNNQNEIKFIDEDHISLSVIVIESNELIE